MIKQIVIYLEVRSQVFSVGLNRFRFFRYLHDLNAYFTHLTFAELWYHF
jgi:hypothetical protein